MLSMLGFEWRKELWKPFFLLERVEIRVGLEGRRTREQRAQLL